MVQQEFVFDDAEPKESKKGAGSFLWNSETREFLGRDGASWAKITFFYAIFYTCLASFFVGMLAVFVSFMPRDKPTYYGTSSTMASSSRLNPGLGFRPQIDVEDSLIMYNPLVAESPTEGYIRHTRNLKNFLDAKYKPVSGDEFDYEKVSEGTDCTEESSFGFRTNRPCVLVKLNKIISWTPETENNKVIIKCEGETSVDKDNLRNVTYHSENDPNNNEEGSLAAKHFPFSGEKTYKAPFVWAQFDVTPNTLVNIECKAYAKNIDNSDRMNRRGQTKFSLFIVKKP